MDKKKLIDSLKNIAEEINELICELVVDDHIRAEEVRSRLSVIAGGNSADFPTSNRKHNRGTRNRL